MYGSMFPTSFPGSLILQPSLAPGGGKMRDPGNEVGMFPLIRTASRLKGDKKPWCRCSLHLMVFGLFLPLLNHIVGGGEGEGQGDGSPGD